MNGYPLEEFRLDKDMPPRRLERVLLARNSLGILIPPSRHGEYPDWGDFHWENFYVVRFGQSNLSPRVHQVLADQLNDAVLAYVNILKKGYQRVGLVTTAARGTRLRFLAGYLYAQAQDVKNRPFPPLLFAEPTGQDNLSKLVAWLKNSKPVQSSPITPQYAICLRAGDRVPEDVGLAATSVVDGYADAGTTKIPTRSAEPRSSCSSG